MKVATPVLSMLLFVSGACGKERTFIGSTPAHSTVRSFLGISLTDSVDFIRWKLILSDNWYEVQCHYGIGQANTNGFVNGGAKLAFRGDYQKEKNDYHFRNGTKTLKAVELNTDLLHILNADNSLMVGNGGWSYTLNNSKPTGSAGVSLTPAPTPLKDSMVFEGRTPCGIPAVIAPGTCCYKLKWLVVLYSNTKVNQPGRYKIQGTVWRNDGGRTGTWQIISGHNGRTIYQLNDEKGKGYLYLLKLDDYILAFTDAQGKLLVGNEDFSYTLNRRR